MTATVTHDMNCPRGGKPHSDDAKRTADAYNLHLTASGVAAVGRFIAVRLADGGSDGALYDSSREAVRHQHHNEHRCMVIRLRPNRMSPCEAEVLLTHHRKQHDRSMRLLDRDHRAGGRVVIPRLTVEDQMAQVHQILFGTRPTNLIWAN